MPEPILTILHRSETYSGVYAVPLDVPPLTSARTQTGSNPELLPRPRLRDVDAEDVDPATWRKIDLLVWRNDDETCDVSLLRPVWWIERAGAKVGGLIRLSMPEMGVDSVAKVLAIGPCPELEAGPPGTQVVTGTFKHTAKLVLHLHLTGLPNPVGVTPVHPFYSRDRMAFVPAGQLRVGERLQTFSGDTAIVERIVPVPGEQTVYNLEVHKSHVYYVSELSVLVHNAYAANESLGENFRFRGARNIDPLRTATHQEIANAFESTGFKPSSHFIMRVKDIRTLNLGLVTFGDLAAIFRNGTVVAAGDSPLGALISVQHGEFEVIINAVTKVLVTLKPL